MIQGYNHNLRYGGRVFHVQTEDSGLANPHIITHLYHGGTIVASRKTSYADIVIHERRDEVIRDIMREQHRQMLLDLRDGRLDDTLGRFKLAPDPKALAAGRKGRAAPSGQQGPGHRRPAPRRLAPPEASPTSPAAPSADDILLDYLASRVGPDAKKS